MENTPASADPAWPWQQLTVDETARVFDRLGIRWWIAGGLAIDLFLGKRTRPHGDIDVAILRGDRAWLRALEPEFDLFIADSGSLRPWSGRELTDAEHQFWARRHGEQAWAFEVLLEQHEGERWVYRRNAAITLPVSEFGRIDAAGVPFVAPAVALFYKSNRPDEPRNAADFARAWPCLTAGERAWLIAVLRRTDAAHPWLDPLVRAG